MTYKKLKEYFIEVAKDHIEISHEFEPGFCAFKEFNIDDVVNGISIELDHRCLFLEDPDIRAQDALSDNPRKLFTAAFLVMQPLLEKGNPFEVIEIIDNNEEIVEDIISRIKNDQKNFNLNKSYPFKIKGFNLDSISIQKVGPIFNKWYGWRAEFTINQTFKNNLILDPLKWRTSKPSSI